MKEVRRRFRRKRQKKNALGASLVVCPKSRSPRQHNPLDCSARSSCEVRLRSTHFIFAKNTDYYPALDPHRFLQW